jgi:2-oxoisovalerate dehydrogenase E1 component alpha subunit
VRKGIRRRTIRLGEWDEERHSHQEAACKQEIRDIYKQAEAMGTLSGATNLNDFTMFEQVYEAPPTHLKNQMNMFKEEQD